MIEAVKDRTAPGEDPDGGRRRLPPGPAAPVPWTRRRVRALAAVWTAAVVLSAALVVYGLGGLMESRQQRALLDDMRGDIARAVGLQQTLFAKQETPRVPGYGEPVAIVQIPRLKLQQVIVEGADPGGTQAGPAHVAGTAGPGQPGNSVVAGRRHGFGAPFLRLTSLRPGDDIIVFTVQGQALYKVRSVARTNLSRRDVQAPSRDDRLTLITSASWAPWESGRAYVVVAAMSGLPYPATPQATLSEGHDGRHGDPAALPLFLLFGGGFAGAAYASVMLYRRWLMVSTYVLSAPVLVALLVLATEAGTRLLPAWT
ncbi:sortase [Actinomadura rugatobispora]|uniref:Sortase n=1 Tax=Actinomadura rugatobispora TaxID=1994 RepID=A0ABW1AAV3_9ACTN|nr:class E sortase [Actinomadura rugatobispora]